MLEVSTGMYSYTFSSTLNNIRSIGTISAKENTLRIALSMLNTRFSTTCLLYGGTNLLISVIKSFIRKFLGEKMSGFTSRRKTAAS